MSLRKYFSALLLIPLFAAAPAAFADPVYSVTFLPRDFTASALNRDGLIVGTAGGGAAIWSPGSTTYLASLLPGSEGTAINGDGVITGRFGRQAFMYDGSVQTFSTANPFYVTWATGINDARQVSGNASQGLGISRGFLYSDGNFTDMGSFGGDLSIANAINASGHIAGLAGFGTGNWSDPDYHASVYRDGTLVDLGTLGGRLSEASDINDAGLSVGWSNLADDVSERPFLFLPDEARMIDLGSLGGSVARANGINNGGTVVGLSDIGGADMGFDYHAFVYGAGGMADLNTLVKLKDGWTLVTATDVNDAGQILAQACRDSLSECRAVRLDLIAAVPEPGTWAMLAAGMVLLLWRARRRTLWIAAAPLLAAPLASAQQLPAQDQAATAPAAQYRPVFMPAGFDGRAINASGHVAGYNGSAALWDGSKVTDYAAVAPGSFALGLNDRGTMVGFWAGDAFSFAPSGLLDLGQQGVIWEDSAGAAINDAGMIAGNAGWTGGERARGFTLAYGVVRMIPSFGGDWSVAAAINRSGQVTGTAATAEGPFVNPVTRAFIFKDRSMRMLPTLGGKSSSGNDINNAGQVVGYASIEQTNEFGEELTQPFLYSGGSMRNLGTLGGNYASANGLNNAGAVVGDSEIAPDDFAVHAFLYVGATMIDLNSVTAMPPDWLLVTARDINDAGQILARACRFEDCLNVRLDPVPKRQEAPSL